MSLAQLNKYIKLAKLSYEEAIQVLNNQYGEVTDDYFREKSYKRALNGEIKTISRGKATRSKEGLYVHHNHEDKYLNMSNLDFIRSQNIPYDSQRKGNLVYADLAEHAILHALIIKKTKGKFGYPGYDQFIRPMLIDWKIWDKTPKPIWMQKAKARIDLSFTECNALLDFLQDSFEVYLDQRIPFLQMIGDSLTASEDYIRIAKSDFRFDFETVRGLKRVVNPNSPFGNHVGNLVRYRFKKGLQENFHSSEKFWGLNPPRNVSQQRELEKTFRITFEKVAPIADTLSNEEIIAYFEKNLRPFFLAKDIFLKEDLKYWKALYRQLNKRTNTRNENYQFALNQHRSILSLFSSDRKDAEDRWIATHPQLLMNGISRKTSLKELYALLKEFSGQNYLFWSRRGAFIGEKKSKEFTKMAKRFNRHEIEDALEKLLAKQEKKLKEFVAEREKIQIKNHGFCFESPWRNEIYTSN